jgi:hypothetical protein
VRILIKSDSNSGDHREDVEEEPADRVVGVVDGSAEVERDLTRRELVDVERGERVALRGESLAFGGDAGVADVDSHPGQCAV